MSSSDPWKTFRYSEAECRERLAAHADSVWTLHDGERFVGFFAVQRHGLGSAPMLSLICLSEQCRGQGVGSAAIQAIEDATFRTEKNLYICVSDFNTRAVQLYQRLGYRQIGTISDYNFSGSAEFILRKTTGAKRDHLKSS